MKFFEKPKTVTAVVFFVQTLLALLNMSVFLYLGFFELIIALALFVTFPFMFHHIYSFIINDLDTVDEDTGELKKIPFKLNDDFSAQKKTVTPSKETKSEVTEVTTADVQSPLEAVSTPPAKEEEENVKEAPNELSEAEKAPSHEEELHKEEETHTTPSRLARKQITVTDVEFVDEESETTDDATPAKPIAVKKAKTHRLEQKRLAVEKPPADTNENDKEES